MVVHELVHQVISGQHEAVKATLKVDPMLQTIIDSRRRETFDRSQLKDPAVQAIIRGKLAKLTTPSRFVEKNTRAHVLSRAVRGVLEEVIPEREAYC